MSSDVSKCFQIGDKLARRNMLPAHMDSTTEQYQVVMQTDSNVFLCGDTSANLCLAAQTSPQQQLLLSSSDSVLIPHPYPWQQGAEGSQQAHFECMTEDEASYQMDAGSPAALAEKTITELETLSNYSHQEYFYHHPHGNNIHQGYSNGQEDILAQSVNLALGAGANGGADFTDYSSILSSVDNNNHHYVQNYSTTPQWYTIITATNNLRFLSISLLIPRCQQEMQCWDSANCNGFPLSPEFGKISLKFCAFIECHYYAIYFRRSKLSTPANVHATHDSRRSRTQRPQLK
jgi:hypothetical protein